NWSFDPTTNLKIRVADSDFRSLQIYEQFVPVLGSPQVHFSGSLAFVGFGIHSPEYDYSDFEEIDLQGKVAVILRHEPQLNDAASRFSGTSLTRHGLIREKIQAAQQRGATAVLLCNDSGYLDRKLKKGDGQTDPLIRSNPSENRNYTIPVLHVQRSIVERWMVQGGGPTLRDAEAELNAQLKPASHDINGHHIQGEIHIRQNKSFLKNVIGYLPGTGNLANEVIIVGAHYDHLGMGQFGSLAPWTVEIHNGADDNASGTAGILELGWRLFDRQSENHRAILLIAFSGEEMGLLGSEYYCKNPLFPLESTVAMVNLDMVGRLSTNGRVEVYGVDTAQEFRPSLSNIARSLSIETEFHPEGYGPSDHATFYQRNIPVLHFFTGLHKDYHRPSDDFDKVDTDGLSKICDLVELVVWQLATDPDRPKPTSPGTSLSLEGSLLSDIDLSRDSGLGIRLKRAKSGEGFQIVGFENASLLGADQLQSGDIILSINGRPLETLKQWLDSTEDRTRDYTISVQRGGIRLKIRMPASMASDLNQP
ncbi:MAG: M28 family peptidase, partial [Planctomycetota bacterium]|nr:M28 family peptidase [Planctomycetota bacterium]